MKIPDLVFWTCIVLGVLWTFIMAPSAGGPFFAAALVITALRIRQ